MRAHLGLRPRSDHQLATRLGGAKFRVVEYRRPGAPAEGRGYAAKARERSHAQPRHSRHELRHSTWSLRGRSAIHKPQRRHTNAVPPPTAWTLRRAIVLPQHAHSTNVSASMAGDRIDELLRRRQPRQPGRGSINPARKIRGPSAAREHIFPVDKDRRRSGEWHRGSILRRLQEPIPDRRLTEAGHVQCLPKAVTRRHPTRAVDNMEDLDIHTSIVAHIIERTQRRVGDLERSRAAMCRESPNAAASEPRLPVGKMARIYLAPDAAREWYIGRCIVIEC
jgi:hypothetical protein